MSDGNHVEILKQVDAQQSKPSTPDVTRDVPSDLTLADIAAGKLQAPTSEDREIPLRNGEVITLPSMHIDQMTLYHGSATPGIEEFQEAEEATVGNGLYLTSQKDAAIDYARNRHEVNHAETSSPVVYETEVTDVTMADLRSRTAIESFAQLFREELEDYDASEVPPYLEGMKDDILARAAATITMIDENSFQSLKDIAAPYGNLVRKALARNGYDGLVTYEGGEQNVREHDSYVIFQPEKATITNEAA